MFLWVSGAAMLIFRSELAILLGLILLMELVRGGVTVSKVIAHVIPAGLVLLGELVKGSCVYWQLGVFLFHGVQVEDA